MEILFDADLVSFRRRRAVRAADKAGDRSAAFLLDIAAQELADRLSVVERRFEQAVELHGATGAVAEDALATGKIDRIERIETDEAFAPMPAATMAKQAGSGIAFRIAALDDVPIEPASANLILSPLALHLANDLPGTLVRIRRALKPDGLMLAALPGSGTLAELRDVLLAAEAEQTGGASPRVIPFADVRDIGGLLQRAGFALPVVDQETHTVRYDNLFALMRDLRAMGMSNPLSGRSRKPLTRGFFLRAAELYAERHADADGRIRATFTIIYASGWAPHESQQKPLKPGSATIRLEDALKGAAGKA